MWFSQKNRHCYWTNNYSQISELFSQLVFLAGILYLWNMVAHNCHGKNKNIMAKPKTSRQKQNTSWQNQVLHSKSKIALVLLWVFAFAVGYLVFAVRSLVLLWGFWFCCEVFCFCREVFVKFLFLAWGCWFCREVFCICRDEVFGFVVTVLGHHIETLKLVIVYSIFTTFTQMFTPQNFA